MASESETSNPITDVENQFSIGETSEEQKSEEKIEIKDILEKYKSEIKEIADVIVVNSDGMTVKSTLQNSNLSMQYSVLISQLCERAKNTVTDLDPSDELIYFRLMGKKEEILVTPEEDFIMITVQNNIARRNPDPEVEIPKEE